MDALRVWLYSGSTLVYDPNLTQYKTFRWKVDAIRSDFATRSINEWFLFSGTSEAVNKEEIRTIVADRTDHVDMGQIAGIVEDAKWGRVRTEEIWQAERRRRKEK